MARAGAARMAQKTHATELILMPEKNCTLVYFLAKNIKYSFCWDWNSLPVDSLDFFRKSADFCFLYKLEKRTYTGVRTRNQWLRSPFVQTTGPN